MRLSDLEKFNEIRTQIEKSNYENSFNPRLQLISINKGRNDSRKYSIRNDIHNFYSESLLSRKLFIFTARISMKSSAMKMARLLFCIREKLSPMFAGGICIRPSIYSSSSGQPNLLRDSNLGREVMKLCRWSWRNFVERRDTRNFKLFQRFSISWTWSQNVIRVYNHTVARDR